MNVVTERTFSRHELIGLKVRVLNSSNPLHIGIDGVVVDETKNTLVIASNSRKMRVPKENATYGFTLLNGTFISIGGKQLLGRPVDRIRRTLGRKWS